MSQTKAQLIQPIGVVTASTIQVSGVVTATTLIGDVTGTVSGLSTTTANLDVGIVTTSSMVGDVTGSASSVYSGNNIVAGVVTATKFTGNTSGRSSGLADGTNANIGIITATSFIGNLTGNAASLSNTDSQLNLGIVTATSFAGNFTGIGSGLTGTPNVVAGVVTSTFVGNFTGIGSGLSGTPNVRAGVVTASSFVGDFTGIGSGLTGTPNVTAGVVTASSFIGNFTGHASGLTGTPNVTAGLVTASSLLGNFTGFASGITGTPNITAGVVTASAFAGNFTGIGSGLTGTPDYTAGIVTATFVGNFTGIGSGLTGTPTFTAGIVTASSFIGNFTGIGSGLTGTPTFTAGIVTASSFLGNFTGVASGITGTPNITVGIMTGTLNGDGSNLTGIAATAFVTNNVTANGSNTTIDLNNGDNIILTQTANTTIAFSNVSTSHVISILRANGTGTITWPDAVKWDGGTAPTMIENPRSSDFQQFGLLTRDGGTTWFGWENLSNDPQNVEMYSWGANNYGNCMRNQPQGSHRSSPIQIPGTNWSTISDSRNLGGAGYVSFAGKQDGTLWVSGSPKEDGNGTMRGVTGRNNSDMTSSPVQIPGTNWTGFVVQGIRHVAATKTDGTLWMWGYNGSGQLGQNNKVSYSSPVQVPGTWKTHKGAVTMGQNHTLAVASNGGLYTWGKNDNGNMGIAANPGSSPSNYRRSSPIQLGGSSGSDYKWNTVTSDPWSGQLGTKTDGTLWSWGYNANGNLGQGDTTNQSSPIQIPGTTWSAAISLGNRAARAVKTDGTMWAWGYNGSGMLGQGNQTQYSSPRQIPGTTWGTDFDNLGSVAYGKAAVKTDGTLWTWGQNEQGQLGHNNKTNREDPTQVPGTNWIAVGGYGTGKGFKGLKQVD